MAARAYDSDGQTCFIDANNVIGWYDDLGNWLGFVPEDDTSTCAVGYGGRMGVFVSTY